jgi:transposase
MEMWRDIRRRVIVDGESKRLICREYGIHFKTLQKILSNTIPPGYRQTKRREKRKIGPHLTFIEGILEEDKKAPRKQRHTAKRIFDRLISEQGYDGGYTAVKEAVRAYRHRTQEVFVPLSHPPGWAQVDFGYAKIELDGEQTEVAFFVMTLPYSDTFFIRAFFRECTETFQEGHKRAFEFFGAIPVRISYDNSKIAVISVGRGRNRKLTDGFLRLQSHYHFTEHFCRVRRPNEKGHVENLVGFSRRNFMVPVPKVKTIEELNRYLETQCRNDLKRTLRGKEKTKNGLLQEELPSMLPLPRERFEAHRVEKTSVGPLSLVRFDRNDYSVPTEYAHHPVTAIGTVEEVRLVVNDHLAARHPRSWGKHGTFFNPIHYLALLERKPGAFDFSRPLEEWTLPSCFDLLRRRLESDLQGSNGTREFIKILRLLEKVSLPQLTKAVEQALFIGAASVDAVKLILEYRRQEPIALFCLDGHPHLKSVRVPEVDLSCYDGLTEGGQ